MPRENKFSRFRQFGAWDRRDFSQETIAGLRRRPDANPRLGNDRKQLTYRCNWKKRLVVNRHKSFLKYDLRSLKNANSPPV
ncbi:MAG: hypothetical protein ACYC35_24795 [Pirellulales bacterium]